MPAWQLFHLWNHVDYLSPAYHENLRVFVCTQKAQNTQNCDLFHSRSMRMKTFCEFCGFCVRYYFLVSREGAKAAKFFINVITGIKLIFGAEECMIGRYGRTVRASLITRTFNRNLPMNWGRTPCVRTYQVGNQQGICFIRTSELQNFRTSELQNIRTAIFTLRRESVSSVKSRWINYGVLIRGALSFSYELWFINN